MVEINGDRLLADLSMLRTFGQTGTGVVRPTFSDVDIEARRWLASRMADAGLTSTVDGVGNVVGKSPNTGPALLIGSHSDTQPTGGWLDGALGVVYGLEVARALLEDPDHSDLAVDAVAWSDEESSYISCLGSRSFCGILTDEDVQTATNVHGETITKALDRTQLTDVPRVTLDPNRHFGYLEAHIEQGPHLESTGNLIGAVTSIVGIRSARINFLGQQNHAGTTPMPVRADAGVALFEYAVELRKRFTKLAETSTVWTIGNVQLAPGAESIIPGHAELLLQFRDPDEERLAAMDEALDRLAEEMTSSGPVAITINRGRESIAPTMMDAGFIDTISNAAEARAPHRWVQMPSAAGHDPMVISAFLPCGMLFIPSIGGISHDFAEDSSHEDIVLGCRVLADAAVALLSAAGA